MRDSIIIGIMELALLTLSLLAATFVVCLYSLQTVLTQFVPDPNSLTL